MALRSGKLEILFQTIHEIVDSSGPWKEKRDRILEEAKDSSEWETSFNEFLSWFEKDQP